MNKRETKKFLKEMAEKRKYPGVKNKLKINDKVQLTAKCHSWHTSHIIDTCSIHNRFSKNDYEEIAMLLLSKARRVKLKGKILNYGSEEDINRKLKFVNVEFSYKDMTTSFYCSESDLKKL